jgi:hypothetical protein
LPNSLSLGNHCDATRTSFRATPETPAADNLVNPTPQTANR